MMSGIGYGVWVEANDAFKRAQGSPEFLNYVFARLDNDGRRYYDNKPENMVDEDYYDPDSLFGKFDYLEVHYTGNPYSDYDAEGRLFTPKGAYYTVEGAEPSAIPKPEIPAGAIAEMDFLRTSLNIDSEPSWWLHNIVE